MAIINDVTINYSIPMPNIGNSVSDDMTRLRAAFTNIDTYLLSKADKADTYTKSEVESIAATILTATSTSSIAIGTGSKTFATQANKQFSIGQFVVVSSSANPANFMFGQVTSYSATTLVVNVVVVGGSGTLASWKISISGIQGLQGVAGANGATGAQGIQGVAGATGAAGVAGAAGATWYSGSGVPAIGTGINNDYYFRTDTSDIYKKVAGSWGSPIANIKGATGATGAQGIQGVAGAAGASAVVEWTGAVPALPNTITLTLPNSFIPTDCCILVDKNNPSISTALFEVSRTITAGVLQITYNQGYADFGNLTSRTWLVIPQNQTMRLRDWGVATDFPANAIPRVETGSGVNWITYAHLKTINGQSLFSYVDGENITTTPATQPLTITATNANYLPFFIRIPPRATEVNGVIQAASPTDKWVESVTWTGGAMTSISFDDLKGVGANFVPASMSSLTSLSLPALISVGTIFNPNTMSSLTSLSLPALVNVGGVFSPNGMALTSLSLPELVNVGGAFNPYNMTSLTSISFGRIERIGMSATSGSIFYLTSGTANVTTLDVPATLKQIGIAAGNVVLTSCKLNQASVDNLLVRLAALDGTNGTVTFNGRTVTITGTSSTPSATGLAAKATLVARGCTVTHN